MLAVGPGGVDKDGKRVNVSVNVGDKVLIPQVSLCSIFYIMPDGREGEGGGGDGKNMYGRRVTG